MGSRRRRSDCGSACKTRFAITTMDRRQPILTVSPVVAMPSSSGSGPKSEFSRFPGHHHTRGAPPSGCNSAVVSNPSREYNCIFLRVDVSSTARRPSRSQRCSTGVNTARRSRILAIRAAYRPCPGTSRLRRMVGIDGGVRGGDLTAVLPENEGDQPAHQAGETRCQLMFLVQVRATWQQTRGPAWSRPLRAP